MNSSLGLEGPGRDRRGESLATILDAWNPLPEAVSRGLEPLGIPVVASVGGVGATHIAPTDVGTEFDRALSRGGYR
jgi:hypothetical protein